MLLLSQRIVPTRATRLVLYRFKSTVTLDATAEVSRPVDWNEAKPYSAIPGPKPLPIVGNSWRFMPVIGEFYKVNIGDVMGSFGRDYGPVSKLSGLLSRPDVVVISDPTLVEKVLRHEGPWPIRKGAESLEYYFRNIRTNLPVSLASSQGKEWQEFRTAVNQVMMQPRNTRQYVEPIDQVSQEFIERMRLIRDEKSEMPNNFADELAKWALESITYVALDARLGLLKGDLSPDSEGPKMINAVHTVFECMYKLDFLPSPWRYISTPAYRKLVSAMDYYTEISSKYVNLAMDRLKNLPETEIKDRNYSVLENLLIKTGDPNKAVTMALDMLLAGVDTTSTVVATVMYQLATNPEKQQRLQEELDRVISDPDKPVTQQQLEELKYMRACIKESMRKMPIILGNARNTVKDMTVGGYQVPTGTMINFVTAGVYDNDTYFPRAKEFLPERWLPGGEALKVTHPFAYLPFGFGPRMCVGRRFADLEIETIIARTFRNFTLEWKRTPVKTDFSIILTFADPLKFTVKDRK